METTIPTKTCGFMAFIVVLMVSLEGKSGLTESVEQNSKFVCQVFSNFRVNKHLIVSISKI